MQKDFDGWNIRKKTIDGEERKPDFHEREIWWCSFGVNVGREQDGRSNNFERPLVVIKKLSPDTFCALPLSTKKKLERFQSVVTHADVHGHALLDQVRVLDSKRLLRKIGSMEQGEFLPMKKKLGGVSRRPKPLCIRILANRFLLSSVL